MTSLVLHPMKEVRVIIPGEEQSFVIQILDTLKISGYTIIKNLSGKGRHGFHVSHPMFDETESLLMIMTVVPEEKVPPILSGLAPILDRDMGVMFVSDVAVSRLEHFSEPQGDG
ncbi:MAG: P-II family nitrogen regulator [Nitrospira sp.]|nr:P-II family nitrogen regulator [Candidatus Manganitrophaceae bacterium]HIL34760.1 P-II family nitrogen regulator [Candidatus Manganitrophaceae bacterium]